MDMRAALSQCAGAQFPYNLPRTTSREGQDQLDEKSREDRYIT